jgi:DNA-binding response OmpR family regulator
MIPAYMEKVYRYIGKEEVDGMPKSRILIVNDEPQIINTLSPILRARGYTVGIASSGMDGLAKAKTDRPDLVIVDVAMSDMDGYAVCSKLKSERATRSTPVIMISDNGGSESVLKARTAGASDYLVKPFDLFTLLSKLNKFLAE